MEEFVSSDGLGLTNLKGNPAEEKDVPKPPKNLGVLNVDTKHAHTHNIFHILTD